MRNWRVAVVGCTELKIHPAVLIYIIYAWMTGHLAFALIALISISLHEIAHAIVAGLCGQPLRAIELTPLGATLRVDDPDKLSFMKRFFVLAAGPLASWFMCIISIWFVQNTDISYELCRLLFMANLSILLINILPAYPLDGGRLLALVLGCLIPKHIVHRIMRIAGMVIGLFLIVLNLYLTWHAGGWNYSLALSGCCLIHSAQTESLTWSLIELREFLDRKIAFEKKQRLPLACYAITSNTHIRDIVRRLPPRRMGVFICVEPGSMRCQGWLTENDIMQHYLNTPSADVLQVLHMSQNSGFVSKYDTI